MEISLSTQEWFVKGYHPWVPIKGQAMETGEELHGVTDWIPATVPGGVHYDLYRAGWIEHPYVDMNSLQCEWVENRWWVYKTSFPRPEETCPKLELVCKGPDYQTLVYLNGVFLGEHEGMYHPAVYDITSVAAQFETLELKLVFKGVPQEMGQIGKTSLTHTQKSRFNYKWDFSTRLVNIGIWGIGNSYGRYLVMIQKEIRLFKKFNKHRRSNANQAKRIFISDLTTRSFGIPTGTAISLCTRL